ncbi:MAG: PorT family protein [Paludibacter sp.]|nr:PorT family protein [Bacteroidales bacterium]MCM1068649.1 PorT family protein [Prevotella sp.]MCM1353313.1 PorT family protein [Bacteroides sp.]MCM1442279.1 PorT family protein [Muribaculum sp.]MCM1481098.1 PorT family protein [Paludibacter sp.]
MKRSLFTCLLLGLTLTLAAQQQLLGVEVGFTQPILRENPATENKKLPNVTTLNGIKLGLVYDATLVKGFGFRLGVNYTYGGNHTKWANETSEFTAQKIKYTNQMHSIEVPIDWQYKFAIAKETWLILYTGPAFQYNFKFDKTTYRKNELLQTESATKESHFAIDKDEDDIRDYRPFNLTWGVGAGFQYQNYYIRGGYDFGILNHYQDRIYNPANSENNYTYKGRFDQWSIKIGIYFLNF